MNQEPNFGPYTSLEPVKSFQLLSTKAFQSYHKVFNQHNSLISRPIHHLFTRMAYQAETTSLSIHLSNSWALNLPALALTRVRLEQTIICSYLIHEDEVVGLAPFVTYISIGEYKGTKAALEDPTIARNLTSVNMGNLEAEAVKAQQDFNPSFTIENDKFERN